jgi:hypothetical protein
MSRTKLKSKSDKRELFWFREINSSDALVWRDNLKDMIKDLEKLYDTKISIRAVKGSLEWAGSYFEVKANDRYMASAYSFRELSVILQVIKATVGMTIYGKAMRL